MCDAVKFNNMKFFVGTFVGHVNASSNSTTNLHYMVLFSQLFTIPDPSQVCSEQIFINVFKL